MARLVTATCPRCGALVPTAPDSDRATCTYCGATATVAKTEQLPMPMPMPVAPRRSGAAVAVLLVFGVLLVVLVGIGAAGWLLFSGAPPPPPAWPPVAAPGVASVPTVPDAPTPSTSPSPPTADATPVVRASGSGVLLALDVDGDHRVEIVSSIERRVGSDATLHYAVFDAHSGAERAHTPAIEGLQDALAAGVGNRLVLAGDDGQLTGYDLVSGDRQWTTALGERVARLCEARAAGAVHVETNDERRLTVDLTTGRQVETRDGCEVLLARQRSGEDPRDRRDHGAPRGVEAWRCGGVTVMGSESYRVPDACLARGHVDTDRLEGMVGHRIWKLGRGWLVFGVRRPGAYVPMVARLERGAFVWKAEVPAQNPLAAEAGSPDEVVLVGDTLVAGYQTGSDQSEILTAFAVADGTRRWTVPLVSGQGLPDLVALDDAVAARVGGVLRVLSITDGAVRATVGAGP